MTTEIIGLIILVAACFFAALRPFTSLMVRLSTPSPWYLRGRAFIRALRVA